MAFTEPQEVAAQNADLDNQGGASLANTAPAGAVEETPEQLFTRAQEFFLEGKRHFLCRNYQEAVTSLDQACELFSERFGEMAYECAEPYFYYGKSLAELERINQTILNVKEKDGAKDEEEGDESEEEENEENHEPEEQPEQQTAADNIVELSDSGKNGTDQRADSQNASDIPKNGENQFEQPDDHQQESVVVTVEKIEEIESAANHGAGVFGDDQPTSSKGAAVVPLVDACDGGSKSDSSTSAWEMLDLARIIYEKHLGSLPLTAENFLEQQKADTLRLAEIRMILGEVCALDEKYDEAIEEYQAARALLVTVCAPDDRRLAQAYFQIGSVSEMNYKFEDATANIKAAAEILALKKRNLENSVLPSENSSTISENLEPIKREIQELTELLADITQRLGDISESEESFRAAKNDLNEFTGKLKELPIKMNGSENGTLAKLLTTDVTHLVRKPIKRVSDGSQDPEPKRAKFEETNAPQLASKENGHGDQAEEKVDEVQIPTDPEPLN